MIRAKGFIRPLLILFLLMGILVIFRSFLIPYIIEPAALLFWTFWQTISGVDQNVYWILLIVICAGLIIRLLPLGKVKSARSAYSHKDVSTHRVEYWRTIFIESELGKNEHDHLRDSLKRLISAIIAQGERANSTQKETVSLEEKVSLSPDAHGFLFPTGQKTGVFPGIYQRSFMILTPMPLRKWIGKLFHQDYTVIEETIQWMENQLEIEESNHNELETIYE